MADDDPVWQAKRHLRAARECMAGGDAWSAGYEVGLALGTLERLDADGGDDG